MRQEQGAAPVRIGDCTVGPGHPTFLVAEIGINHNGDMDIAKRLIDLAAIAGASAVKFQTRTVGTVYSLEELARPRPVPRNLLENAIRRGTLSAEAVTRLRKSDFEDSTNGDLKWLLELTDNELREIDDHCRERGIIWFTACWDTASVDRIEELFPGTPAHKIPSPCNQDDELLRRLRKTGKPLILSTGMTDLDGIRAAVYVLGTENLIVLHCASVYPTGTTSGDEMLGLINLRGITTLQETFGVPIGLSSHDSGIQPAYAAAVLGACMVEKHITLERGMWGSDQGSSIDPIDLPRLGKMLQELPLILGDGKILVNEAERAMEQKLRRVWRKAPVS
ncbi:MAG: N-acetylneuraminate synthase family protein [Patescibacteria group bacterium]|nr:N-acetylneuraminate synthase family protein [Patescibacteria group bacterium]